MKADKLIVKIRLRLGDMQATQYSDYELLAALSEARQMLWLALAENFSTIPQRTETLALVAGAALLPDDFYSLVCLPPPAYVDGDMVRDEKNPTAEVSLVYNAIPPAVAGIDDDVSFAGSLLMDMTEISYHVAKGEMDAAQGVALSSARRVSQKREMAAIPDTRPFP